MRTIVIVLASVALLVQSVSSQDQSLPLVYQHRDFVIYERAAVNWVVFYNWPARAEIVGQTANGTPVLRSFRAVNELKEQMRLEFDYFNRSEAQQQLWFDSILIWDGTYRPDGNRDNRSCGRASLSPSPLVVTPGSTAQLRFGCFSKDWFAKQSPFEVTATFTVKYSPRPFARNIEEVKVEYSPLRVQVIREDVTDPGKAGDEVMRWSTERAIR
ncbi:MAG: hypothetical protein FJ202_11820 [Gemmatimonadetes bacterium]|nr:hypothetical protein [Gemmatimonadota bacterium]